MYNQLELFDRESFSLRLKIEDAMHIFWEQYWNFLPTAQTTKAHRKRICLFFRGRFIDSFSKADIEEMRRNFLLSGLSPQTVNKAQMVLSRMFTKFSEWKDGRIAHGMDYSKLNLPPKNPCAMVPRPRAVKRKQVAKQEEIKRIRYYADDDMTDIINMLLYSKLRPGDLQRLTESSVDIRRRRIEITQHKTITTKNPSGIQIMIPITDKMADILKPRMKRTTYGWPLFPFRNMQKRWKEIRIKANAMHIQMRDLRRTAATFALDNGTDPLTVAQGLGHADLSMLPTYTPRTLDQQRESIELVENNF